MYNAFLTSNTSYATDLNSIICNTNGAASNLPSNTIRNMESQCTIKLSKAENGGFVILVYTNDQLDNNHNPKSPKVYINHNVENLGKDIQNALLLELMKA